MLLKGLTREKKVGLTFAVAVIFFDMLLYSVIIPLTPYYEEAFKASPTMIGFLFSSYSITLLIFTPYFGSLTDRIGRKKPLVIGLAGMVLATVLFAHPLNFGMLVIARGLQGMASAATFTAALALIADLFTKKERAVYMGFAMTGMSMGMLLGAPIGGFLVDFGGYQAPFYIISVLMVIFIFYGGIYLKEIDRPEDVQNPERLISLLKKPAILWILVLLVVSEGALTMLEPILPIYLSGTYSNHSVFIGLMFGLITLAYGVMAPVSGVLVSKYPSSRVVLIGLLFSGLTLPFIVLSTSVFQLVLALLILGGSLGIAISPTLAMMGETQEDSEQASYGVLYSLFNLFFAIAAILGPLTGGVLTDVFSAKTTIFIASGTILFFTFVLSLSRRKSMGQLRTQGEETIRQPN